MAQDQQTAKAADQPATVKEFLLDTPLYTTFVINSADALGIIEEFVHKRLRFDGHCPYCRKETTFSRDEIILNPNIDIEKINFRFLETAITCARNGEHAVKFFVLKTREGMIKVGQFPSLADIANDKAKAYQSVLDKVDAREFHRAIGLAAHGVGIGSFVYLRRVFERLLKRTFDEHKAEHTWKDADLPSRINERIDFLKDHLPAFLVGNRRMYKILSKGIHELSDEECLAVFQPIQFAMIEILEDEKKAREKELRRKEAERALAAFGSGDEK